MYFLNEENKQNLAYIYTKMLRQFLTNNLVVCLKVEFYELEPLCFSIQNTKQTKQLP